MPAVTAVHVKVGFTVNKIAPRQLSFNGAGGGVVTQISKFATVVAVAVLVNTRA